MHSGALAAGEHYVIAVADGDGEGDIAAAVGGAALGGVAAGEGTAGDVAGELEGKFDFLFGTCSGGTLKIVAAT